MAQGRLVLALPTRNRDFGRILARVVLTGAFCEQPPLALIKSIELSGCYVVDDDFMVAKVHAAFVARTPGFEVAGVAHSGATVAPAVSYLGW